jgi:hypothetical protein
MSILETYNLKQIHVVNEPTIMTKESKTLIYHIYITNLEKLQESHVFNILFSISLNKLYQIFKASLGSSTYSTLLNGAYDKSFKNSLSTKKDIISINPSNHIRPHRLVIENDLKVDNSIDIANTFNKFFTSCVENVRSENISKFISQLSGILNFCIIPFRLFISFNSFCYNWCMFISISLNKLYQIFKASLGSSTYSTELSNAISFNSDIVLTGDFNMNFLPPCKPSQKWLSILETYNLKQIVNEPTRVTFSGILNFCIIPFRLFISFNSFCYNWYIFI